MSVVPDTSYFHCRSASRYFGIDGDLRYYVEVAPDLHIFGCLSDAREEDHRRGNYQSSQMSERGVFHKWIGPCTEQAHEESTWTDRDVVAYELN